MLRKSILFTVFNYCRCKKIYPKYIDFYQLQIYPSINSKKFSTDKDVTIFRNFESISDKSKKNYLDMIKIFENRDPKNRRGHVEFVYSALRNMKEFGVHKDLDVYKALIDVLPKGKFIPTNIFQVEFMHYPKQQQCIIDLLEQMEDNGVMPDFEMEDLLMNIFGKRGFPLRKFWRMMYWMPKFRNLSPWPLPEKLPKDTLELAKLAVARINSIDIQSKVVLFKTKDIPEAVEDTWIVSGQSETQKKLLEEHNAEKPLYIEGQYRIWIKNKAINYFILRADAKPILSNTYDSDDVSNIEVPLFNFAPPVKKELYVVPSVHEQQDGVIMAVCVTGTSGRDSLLSWIRYLEKNGNSKLATIPVVFTLRSPEKEIAVVDNSSKIEGA